MAINTTSRTSFKDFAGRVFGTTCPGCLKVSSSVCKNCVEQISQIESLISSPKFHSVYKDVSNEARSNVGPKVIVAFGYSKIVRQMILSMKYRNMRSSVAVLGAALAERITQETAISDQKIDLISWGLSPHGVSTNPSCQSRRQSVFWVLCFIRVCHGMSSF